MGTAAQRSVRDQETEYLEEKISEFETKKNIKRPLQKWIVDGSAAENWLHKRCG